MRHFLDFEKPIAELESKIDELRRMSEPEGINIAEEVARMSEKADRQLRATYAKLTRGRRCRSPVIRTGRRRRTTSPA